MFKFTSKLRRETVLVFLFTIWAFSSNAQTKKDGAVWSTSKDVQRVANKALFQDENLRKSHIHVISEGTPSMAVSKGIYKTNKKAKANMVSKGIPKMAVSKQVALIGKD